MDLTAAARKVNETGYGYIASWALLTACEQRLFDRLPASSADLTDTYPDPDLVDTWLHVLAEQGFVEQKEATWQMPESMERLLVGDNSYADYLGGQILQQMAPRMTLGVGETNVLADVLLDPDSRVGYEGWFADAAEAEAYQASQYAGSLGPAKAIAASLPSPDGRVLDLGGGWGAVARSIVKHHDVDVDVVDLGAVVDSAPPVNDRVSFVSGNALDSATWPTDTNGVQYDGAVLSYLFSSIPGDTHEPLLDDLVERDVRWIAIHDFMVGSGAHAAAWSLQHAVFVPDHRSRSVDELSSMLDDRGSEVEQSSTVVDEMTTLVIGCRS